MHFSPRMITRLNLTIKLSNDSKIINKEKRGGKGKGTYITEVQNIHETLYRIRNSTRKKGDKNAIRTYL